MHYQQKLTLHMHYLWNYLWEQESHALQLDPRVPFAASFSRER